MKIETFAANARRMGHSVRIDRKNRCATTSDNISDGYRIDVYVHFDEQRNITYSYQQKIIRYDGNSDYAGSMPLIGLRDLRWKEFKA